MTVKKPPSEFAFAVVKSMKPLTVTLDGDTTAIPAVAYGVKVSVGDRVQVRLRKRQPPLIDRVFVSDDESSSSGDTASANVAVDTTHFASGLISYDYGFEGSISGWTLGDSSDSMSIADDAITVDSDVFPDGSAFLITITFDVTGITGSGFFFCTSDSLGLSCAVPATPDATPFHYYASSVSWVQDGKIPLRFKVISVGDIGDPAFDAEDQNGIEIYAKPLVTAPAAS